MISANTQKKLKYFLIAALVTFVVAATLYGAILLAAVMLIPLAFIIFITNPELPLAILFNGTLIYFYAVYKLGYQTSTILTGSFYIFLGFSFVLAEMLSLIRKKISFRVSVVDVLFSLFFLLFFLSYFISPTQNDYANKKLIYAPFLAIIPYCGGRFLLSEERIKNFYRYCVLIPAILIVPACYELFFTNLPELRLRFSMYHFENATNPILFSETFAISILIIYVTMLEDRKFNLKKMLLIAIFGWFVLLGGSRGSIVSLMVAGCFYLFVIGKVNTKAKLLSIFIFLVLVGIYCVSLPENMRNFYFNSVSTVPTASVSTASKDTTNSINMRAVQWQEAIRNFVENPFLGIGMGNYNGISSFPHNIILEVAAEFGILGLFIFIPLCYTVVLKAAIFLKNKHLSNLHILMKVLLALFVYTLMHAMFSGHIANQTKLYICMGTIACLDNLKNNSSILLTKKLS